MANPNPTHKFKKGNQFGALPRKQKRILMAESIMEKWLESHGEKAVKFAAEIYDLENMKDVDRELVDLKLRAYPLFKNTVFPNVKEEQENATQFSPETLAILEKLESLSLEDKEKMLQFTKKLESSKKA